MLEIMLLVLSVSIDSFLASIAYGTNKIKIPLSSAFIIDIISSSMLGLSLIVGGLIQNYISTSIARIISFFILFLLGVYRLFESLLKSYIKTKLNNSSHLNFKLFNFNFVLQVYVDETKADFDKSKILTSKEALYLALALSLDSLAVGFGSSLVLINYFQVFVLAIFIGLISIILGSFIGKKLVENININLSWLSGALLIILAFLRAF